MRLRLIAVAISVATLLAGTTVGAATGTPTSGTDEDSVRITIVVSGCPTCKLALQQVREDDPMSSWISDPQKVDHGKVVFDVPAERARGISISITAPWATAYIHGVQFVAVRYGGFAPGDRVSKSQAFRAQRGSRCWSGTDRDRTIRVQVARRTYGSAPEVALRAWATPTLASTNMTDIHDGGIVTTYPVCPAP